MSFRITEDRYRSSDDRTDIFYRFWQPSSPRAVLHIIHGMSEHIDRYNDLAGWLCEHGVAVVGSDLIGHGKSAASEEDLGHIEHYRNLCEDQAKLLKIIRGRYRTLPYIMLGHSMGSFVLRDFIRQYGEDIDGAVISGTAGKNKLLSAAVILAGMIVRIKGERHRSKLLNDLSLGSFSKSFEGPTGFEWLTKDSNIVKKYSEDKYCGFPFTAEGFRQEFLLMKNITAEGWAEKVPLSLPIYIISGADDPVGGNGTGPNEVYDDLNEREVNDLRIKLYSGDRHEILNETDRETVWNDLLEFIKDVTEGVNEARMLGAWPPTTASVDSVAYADSIYPPPKQFEDTDI
ncbi:MAG: alpha/beta fold hydrolase [Eubacteriales bacterium]|jgi:alpha-beta hydrolase superfamily lysophospholipase